MALNIALERDCTAVGCISISAIGNAFAVLNDSKKRKQYDLYGPEEEQERGNNRPQYNYSHGFEGMFLTYTTFSS